MNSEKTFDDILNSRQKNYEILSKFADAAGFNFWTQPSSDGFDIEAYIGTDKKIHFCCAGWCYPIVYDEMLTCIMSSYGWKSIEEIEIWLDLNKVNK